MGAGAVAGANLEHHEQQFHLAVAISWWRRISTGMVGGRPGPPLVRVFSRRFLAQAKVDYI